MANLRLALTCGLVALSLATLIQMLVTHTLQTTWYDEREGRWDVRVTDEEENSSQALPLKPRGAQLEIQKSTTTVSAASTARNMTLSTTDHGSGPKRGKNSGKNHLTTNKSANSNSTTPLANGGNEIPSMNEGKDTPSINGGKETPSMNEGEGEPSMKEGRGTSSVTYAKPGEYFPLGLLYRNQPVNPHPYRFTIQQQSLCKKETGGEEDVFLLILVISASGHFEQWMQNRETCLQTTEVSGRKIKHLFLLAESESEKVNVDILQESKEYRDIVKEDFIDSYRNLTLKTIMGLKWASTYCHQATWVLKIDDDVLLDLNKAVPYLISLGPPKNAMVGKVFRHSRPFRNKESKWYASSEEYAHDRYPNYLCGGGYVIPGQLMQRLYNESQYVPLFYIEDVFIGILADRLRVGLEHSKRFYASYQPFLENLLRRAIIFHTGHISPERHRKLWDIMTNKDVVKR